MQQKIDKKTQNSYLILTILFVLVKILVMERDYERF